MYVNDDFIMDDETQRIRENEVSVYNNYTKRTGKDIYITDNRFPKSGFYYYDRRLFDSFNKEYNVDN